jgi:hypothetical protein
VFKEHGRMIRVIKKLIPIMPLQIERYVFQLKPKGAIKNGQSRETCNIGYTRHRTKTNIEKKTEHRKQSANNDEQQGPH